jgi:multidrug efflux pump subunit AcrA (membrane-fusion protein)
MKVINWKWTLLCAGVLLLSGCHKSEEEAPPKPLVAVKVAQAETAPVEVAVHAPATVFARELANVTARITAPIRSLKVKKGDDVRAGDLLAVLESREVEAQLAEAKAAVADAQLNLERTSAGTLPTDIERARGAVETADAALALAQKVYDRRAGLFKDGAIPQRDLQQSETEFAQARTNATVARRSLDLLRRQSGEKDVAIARSRVEQAQARLAAITAQTQYTEIRSPFAGSITEQFQFPGDMAKPDAPMFTVMDLATVTARAQVPESQIGGVKPGQPCEFASGDTAGEPVKGRITVINRAVDAQRRTVEVWCEIGNAGRKLRGGVFGELGIVTGKTTGVQVPLAAVQFNEGTRNGSVMVVEEKKTARKREVEAGEPQDGKVQILKGVAAGDTVIVEGGYGLPDGTEVTLGKETAEKGK